MRTIPNHAARSNKETQPGDHAALIPFARYSPELSVSAGAPSTCRSVPFPMLRHLRPILLLIPTVVLATMSLLGSATATVKVLATDKTCPVIRSAVQEVANVPFPDGWTVVVACNYVIWEMLQQKGDALGTNTAFTNVTGQITVVNGRMFLKNTVGRPPHRVLLHEIGHIRCNCGDETWAEGWAAGYERKTSALQK